MKTATSHTHWRTLCAFGFTIAAASLASADQNANKSGSRAQNPDNARVELSRSSDVMGRDIIASDGKKVGDIVDLALDLNGTRHITHVLVMTGGFMDIGGDLRAIPIDAINERDGSYRIDLASDAFHRVPLVTQDRQRFFSDPELIASVDRHFASGSAQRSGSEQQSSSNTSGNKSGDTASQSQEIRMLSDLNGREVRGSAGGDLGRIEELWVSLSEARAPFVQIEPGTAVGTPFELPPPRLRYVLPTAAFEGVEEGDAHFDVTSSDLEDAPTVASLDWVNRSTEDSNAVLRLDPSAVRNRSESAQKNNRTGS